MFILVEVAEVLSARAGFAKNSWGSNPFRSGASFKLQQIQNTLVDTKFEFHSQFSTARTPHRPIKYLMVLCYDIIAIMKCRTGLSKTLWDLGVLGFLLLVFFFNLNGLACLWQKGNCCLSVNVEIFLLYVMSAFRRKVPK